MAALTAPPLRHSSTMRDTPFKSTAPIPIPNLRRVNDPPPRSPTRCYETSTDLIFDMSPHSGIDTPLMQQRDPPSVLTHTSAHYARKPLTFSTRFVTTKSPPVERPPYWEEPFLYSVPRLPPRAPLGHSRTQSARVNRSDSFEQRKSTQEPSSYSSSSSLRSFSQPRRAKPDVHDPYVAKAVQESAHVLTAAFQQSFTTATSFTQSFESPAPSHVQFKEPLSPPDSIQGWGFPPRSRRPSPIRHKRTLTGSSVISGVPRTSAAEPIVSFAQAELGRSPSSGAVARVVKVTRTTPTNSLRAKSPYPVVRGRRASTLRGHPVKISDEDIAGTLDKSQAAGKFGLEKFLPQPLPRGRALDENVCTKDENVCIKDENVERGRTRSRMRAGRLA
ncbi:uncharacterized protein PHACADRAFT_265196 [Phanerochaete carnosa HHB-10118-sp]|uniref:Uncharacterized protein n=1 Tax=Phanerochaete carnosa (strain HHB-10118-sp) TaxID=650164 RepID=K5VSS9_PHACS|nr:uncharacterized protein PHACADRAFT_265196 [Phanerochaete carnosa HHB-10118-sp]EKM49634.1 hypothetical protein PHACADRAFT_265196 [Phanerochaete carnosa HHB-10118-sp]